MNSGNKTNIGKRKIKKTYMRINRMINRCNAMIPRLQRTFYYGETFFSMNILFYSMKFGRNMAW